MPLKKWKSLHTLAVTRGVRLLVRFRITSRGGKGPMRVAVVVFCLCLHFVGAIRAFRKEPPKKGQIGDEELIFVFMHFNPIF